MKQPTINDALARRAAVQHFLCTGGYDPKFPAWSGNIIERETKAMADMLQALVAEVKKLSGKIQPSSFPADLVAFRRKNVESMVRGLFRRDEQETVLAVTRSHPPTPKQAGARTTPRARTHVERRRLCAGCLGEPLRGSLEFPFLLRRHVQNHERAFGAASPSPDAPGVVAVVGLATLQE